MIKPLGNRVVISVNDSTGITSGGIIIPDVAKELPSTGEVVAVGSGKLVNGERQPIDISVGDTVIFLKHGGTEVTYGNDDYLILNVEDVLIRVA